MRSLVGRGNLDRLFNVKTMILIDEVAEAVFADAVLENRLVVRKHADSNELAVWRDGDQQVGWCSGIAGQRHQIVGFKDVAKQAFGAGNIAAKQRPQRQRRVAFAIDLGGWEIFREPGFVEDRCKSGRHTVAKQDHQKQQLSYEPFARQICGAICSAVPSLHLVPAVPLRRAQG